MEESLGATRGVDSVRRRLLVSSLLGGTVLALGGTAYGEPTSTLDDLIQYGTFLPSEQVVGYREKCKTADWRESSKLQRATVPLDPNAGGSNTTLVTSYLDGLSEPFRGTLKKGIDANGGWSGQVKLVRWVAPSAGYPFHSDEWQKWPGKDWRRILTSLTFLNDDYEGGEIVFVAGRKFSPERGKTLMFPASWAFSYKESPVTRGTKYVLASHIWS